MAFLRAPDQFLLFVSNIHSKFSYLTSLPGPKVSQEFLNIFLSIYKKKSTWRPQDLSCTQLILFQEAAGWGIQLPFKGPGSTKGTPNMCYNKVNPTHNIEKLNRFVHGAGTICLSKQTKAGRNMWYSARRRDLGETFKLIAV